MNLATTYAGIPIANPFIAGASPLSDEIETAQSLEAAGISALIMHSLFEEQIDRAMQPETTASDQGLYRESTSYFPKDSSFMLNPYNYAGHLRALKDALRIPVIGSLNGVSPTGWVSYAQIIANAGADALELNLYTVPTDETEEGTAFENRLLRVVESVRKEVSLPLAVKISPFFSSIPHFARRLRDAGVQSLVLFNRSFYPEIDLEELGITPKPDLSGPSELPLRLRWLGILHGKHVPSLSVSGGVHLADDCIRAILAGADSVQLVSVLLKRGAGHVIELRAGLEAWMQRRGIDSLDKMKGLLSLKNCPDPAGYERGTYALGLQGWNAPKVKWKG